MRVPAPALRLTMRQSGSASAAATASSRLATLEAGIAGAEHQPLHAPPALDELEAGREIGRVVAARLGVEKVDRREVALAAPRRREPAEAADREHPRRDARFGQSPEHGVEPEAMAADHGEVGRAHAGAEQRDGRLRSPAGSASASASTVSSRRPGRRR